MNMGMIFILTVATLAVIAYAQHRYSRQRSAGISVDGGSKGTSFSQDSFSTSPEQASHNLEYSDRAQQLDMNRPPIRDPLDADFAAEAHGFTGFEKVGKGSRYKSVSLG
jgi:hypothetical protein